MEIRQPRGDNFEKIIGRAIAMGVIPTNTLIAAEVFHEDGCPFEKTDGIELCTCTPDILVNVPETGQVYTFGSGPMIQKRIIELEATRVEDPVLPKMDRPTTLIAGSMAWKVKKESQCSN